MTMLGSTGSTGQEGSPRVLVAEDDRSVRESLVMALGLDGYDVHAVSDGEQALDAVLTSGDREPDVIVLDVMMPFLDGLSVCRRLRARNVKTPILMLTARHEVADRVSGLDAGADDYLVKPFALDELSARAARAHAPHERHRPERDAHRGRSRPRSARPHRHPRTAACSISPRPSSTCSSS